MATSSRCTPSTSPPGISTPTTIAGDSALRFTGRIDHHDSAGIAFFSGARIFVAFAEGPYVIRESPLNEFLRSVHLNATA